MVCPKIHSTKERTLLIEPLKFVSAVPAIHIEMVFADEQGEDMLDHQKYTFNDQLVRRHASQAHSLDQTHPIWMHHVFVLLERRYDGVLMLKA